MQLKSALTCLSRWRNWPKANDVRMCMKDLCTSFYTFRCPRLGLAVSDGAQKFKIACLLTLLDNEILSLHLHGSRRPSSSRYCISCFLLDSSILSLYLYGTRLLPPVRACVTRAFHSAYSADETFQRPRPTWHGRVFG